MLIKRIVNLIEANAHDLSETIQQKLLTHHSVRSYQSIDRDTLYSWIYDVCSRFGYWLEEDSEKGEVEQHYRNLGKERFKQNFKLPEVISALYITKRHLWDLPLAPGEIRLGNMDNEVRNENSTLIPKEIQP